MNKERGTPEFNGINWRRVREIWGLGISVFILALSQTGDYPADIKEMWMLIGVGGIIYALGLREKREEESFFLSST